MKESYWGYWFIILGLFVVSILLLTNDATTTSTQDYYQLKEVANSAIYDSVDYGYYQLTGELRIHKEVFVENFLRHNFQNFKTKLIFYIIDNYNFGSKYLRANKVYATLARLLYGCGLRISEALSLKISDLDFTNNIIHVSATKNNTSRIVCMSDSLTNYIIKYIKHSKLTNDDWFFPSPEGRTLSFTYCSNNV